MLLRHPLRHSVCWHSVGTAEVSTTQQKMAETDRPPRERPAPRNISLCSQAGAMRGRLDGGKKPRQLFMKSHRTRHLSRTVPSRTSAVVLALREESEDQLAPQPVNLRRLLSAHLTARSVSRPRPVHSGVAGAVRPRPPPREKEVSTGGADQHEIARSRAGGICGSSIGAHFDVKTAEAEEAFTKYARALLLFHTRSPKRGNLRTSSTSLVFCHKLYTTSLCA